MNPAVPTILFLFCLTIVVILALVLRHKQKMALIAQGINPLEPNPLKFYRRGLVLACLSIGDALIALANAGKPESGGWMAACVLTLAVGIAYLLYYRATRKSPPEAKPPPSRLAPEFPPKIS